MLNKWSKRFFVVGPFPSISFGIAVQCIFSRGHATLHLAVSVGRSVPLLVTFLNCERFSHYCSCPTICDWIAVYPALSKSGTSNSIKDFFRLLVCLLVHRSVLYACVENAKNARSWCCSWNCLCVCWRGAGGVVGKRLGVGGLCPPVRDDIVTPRHLFYENLH